MYKEQILDLYRKPRKEGTLETDYRAEGENKSCGDHTEIFLEIEDKHIEKVRHQTDGCAICTAAASITSEEIEGEDVGKVEDLDRDWIIDKLGTDISPMRVKCAVLGLKTTQEILKNSD
ncbi:MAG: NifU-like protein involved in Fe-S cluster formation [Candidatus Nanosalina sp. J07AB43]|nr:MAG: NifU-like protein involved in Fe-S cluster formation [Candidatus Nanosalina sp. J07AB43]